MVVVVSRGRIYHYPFKVKELVLISKEIRDEFNKVAKEMKISKTKLINEVYKQFIVGYRTGNLEKTNRNIPIIIQRGSIRKGK